MRYQERDQEGERREHHERHSDMPWYDPEHQPDMHRERHFHLYGVGKYEEEHHHHPMDSFHLYGVGNIEQDY